MLRREGVRKSPHNIDEAELQQSLEFAPLAYISIWGKAIRCEILEFLVSREGCSVLNMMSSVALLEARHEDIQGGIVRFLEDSRLSCERDSEGREWLAIRGHSANVMPMRARSRSWTNNRAANAGFHEETATLVTSYLLGRLRPRAFFDVGAWQGYFSLLAASHLQARTAVHAFEMRPHGVDALNDRLHGIDLPGRVHVRLAGLSDQHVGNTRVWYARMKMFEREPEPREYQESVWRRLKFFVKGNKERALRSVDLMVTSLDRYCDDHGVAPDLMKIDVDGYEGKVLRGARNLLRNAPPTILLELHKDEVQRDGILRADVVKMLFDAGYSALFLTDHQSREQCEVVSVRPGDPLLARQQTDMIVFVPPAR